MTLPCTRSSQRPPSARSLSQTAPSTVKRAQPKHQSCLLPLSNSLQMNAPQHGRIQTTVVTLKCSVKASWWKMTLQTHSPLPSTWSNAQDTAVSPLKTTPLMASKKNWTVSGTTNAVLIPKSWTLSLNLVKINRGQTLAVASNWLKSRTQWLTIRRPTQSSSRPRTPGTPIKITA